MADVNLALLLNQSARLTFVQGEDRAVALQVQDAGAQGPYDLSSQQLVFAIARAGGGTLKRYSQPVPLPFASAVTLNGLSTFTVPSHGLVSGDQVMLQSTTNVALPPPFQAAQIVQVVSFSNDTLGFLASDGTKLALTSPSTLLGSIVTFGFNVDSAPLGKATLQLPAAVTAAAATGQGLDYQLSLIQQDGQRRIILGTGQLDVLVQPCP